MPLRRPSRVLDAHAYSVHTRVPTTQHEQHKHACALPAGAGVPSAAGPSWRLETAPVAGPCPHRAHASWARAACQLRSPQDAAVMPRLRLPSESGLFG